MRLFPGGGVGYHDCNGKPIKTGDTLRFEGQTFVLGLFGPLQGHWPDAEALLVPREPLTWTDKKPTENTVELVKEG